MIDWREVQKRLRDHGFDPGPIDGIRGPRTNQAIVDFKKSIGFRARPFVGELTLKALGFDEAAVKEMLPTDDHDIPWMDFARGFIGLREAPGSANNPTIMDWADDLDVHYPGDDVPWCGLFEGLVMKEAAPAEPQPSNILGARNWLKYGKEVDPGYGVVLVFWRTHPTRSWHGHVGNYVGEDDTAYHVLGGNQSDSVSIVRIAKDRLLGARAPNRTQVRVYPKVLLDRNGKPLSTNEA